jgi:hypothetical protein
MYQVHKLFEYNDGEIYDITQTNHFIKDGDIIIANTCFVLMFKAWPVVITGESSEFHRLTEGHTFEEVFADEYKDYLPQVIEIKTNPDALLDRAVDPVAELEEEERIEAYAWDQRQQYLLDDA